MNRKGLRRVRRRASHSPFPLLLILTAILLVLCAQGISVGGNVDGKGDSVVLTIPVPIGSHDSELASTG